MTTFPRRWVPSAFIQVSIATHVGAVGVVLASPGRWRLALAALVANHLLLLIVGVLPRSRFLGPNLTRLGEPESRDGQVVLTIDDGPDPEVTPHLLTMLEAHGATASFFLIGRRAQRHPDLVAEVIRRGHAIENHTYSHANAFALKSPWEQARDIDRSQRVLTEIAGRPPVYFRPPAGIRGPFLDGILHRRGLLLASWTRRGFDTADGNPERVAKRLTDNLRGGDILLLHDGNAARDSAGKPVTLTSLPKVLEALGERGLCGVALPRPAGRPKTTRMHD